jgi:hypothetical protein
MTTLVCKRIVVAKSKELKTGCNLAECSKEGHGSKRAVLPMMMMIAKEPISLTIKGSRN